MEGYRPGGGGSELGEGALEGDLAGVLEGQAAGGVEEPGQRGGRRGEGVDDVQRDEEIFMEALEVAHDLVVVDGIVELVGIFAEAIAGAAAGGREGRGGEAGGVFFREGRLLEVTSPPIRYTLEQVLRDVERNRSASDIGVLVELPTAVPLLS